MKWWLTKTSILLPKRSVKLSILNSYLKTRPLHRRIKKFRKQSTGWGQISIQWKIFNAYSITFAHLSTTSRSRMKSISKIFRWWACRKTIATILLRLRKRTASLSLTKNALVVVVTQLLRSVHLKWHASHTILLLLKSITKTTSENNCSSSQPTCYTTSRNVYKQTPLKQSNLIYPSIVAVWSIPSKSHIIRPLRNQKKQIR